MNRANSLNGSDWLRYSFSIWRNLEKDADNKTHPAPFPVALASRLIDCYAADPEGIVLDPFAGSGSTLLAAIKSGMRAVGVDINSAYRDIFKNRLSLLEANSKWCYEVQDARCLNDILQPESVEICITSPPYWDILSRCRSADRKNSRPYSTNWSDLGNIKDYDDFLNALATVAKQVGMALRPRGYFILNVMDLRKGPVFYSLHQDAATIIQHGNIFTLNDIIIWDRQADYNSMRPLGYPHKFIVNKVHEYLLVFRKE